MKLACNQDFKKKKKEKENTKGDDGKKTGKKEKKFHLGWKECSEGIAGFTLCVTMTTVLSLDYSCARRYCRFHTPGNHDNGLIS